MNVSATLIEKQWRSRVRGMNRPVRHRPCIGWGGLLWRALAAIFAAVGFLVCGFPAFAAETVATAGPGVHQPLDSIPIVSVPTLSEWGLILLSVLLGVAAVVCIRRKAADRI